MQQQIPNPNRKQLKYVDCTGMAIKIRQVAPRLWKIMSNLLWQPDKN